MKTFLRVFILLGIVGTLAFAANEFDEANTIVSNADTAGKGILGAGLKWFCAVILPICCVGGGMFMGYSQQKKKAEQDQNTNKIYFVMAGAGILGFFVNAAVQMLISRILFGDTFYIFNVISTFWKSAVI